MPNYRNVLKVYKLERELAPDDIALLNTLRSMTDAERELLAETLGPPVKAKASKPATKKFKKCDVCGVSKRAAHHRDVNHKDYHEFDEGGSARKSAHASSIKRAIAGTAGRVVDNGASDNDVILCGDCGGGINENRHHLTSVEGYHEFVAATPTPQAVGEIGG